MSEFFLPAQTCFKMRFRTCLDTKKDWNKLLTYVSIIVVVCSPFIKWREKISPSTIDDEKKKKRYCNNILTFLSFKNIVVNKK